MSVDARNVSFSYGGDDVLRGVSFRAGPGELMAVLGPNGAGKSTLFGCLLGHLRPHAGQVFLGGHDVQTLSGAAIAREIAYIPQAAPVTYNYTVLDAVL
ncbi:MAG: ABC transporter ATP-binding protein, partial [Oscillospiraceae bacterium]|nr:ABC transporter ATP-binding protein [Oscillospiraceae bacterium]